MKSTSNTEEIIKQTKQPYLIDSITSNISTMSISKSDSDFHSDDNKINTQMDMIGSAYSDQAAEINYRSFSKYAKISKLFSINYLL
ncbi:unnamed protein product [Schistosoma mattheei]|uniref:Uncharacterized protein n=1 Tax=Schistosoma mattheei TaxID=31246 RepID=A0A3P8H7Z0_9TREM|nr:unnamed protein product [Schistosoma mattheei]